MSFKGKLGKETALGGWGPPTSPHTYAPYCTRSVKTWGDPEPLVSGRAAG